MSGGDGKAWEDKFKRLAEKAGCSVVRFHDTLYKYKDVDNPADFVISRSDKDPAILVELKSCEKTSFSFSKFPQFDRLLKLVNFRSYLIIWFREYKKILAFEVFSLDKDRKEGVKSINPDKLEKLKHSRAIDLCGVFNIVNPKKLEVNRLWEK